MGMLRAITWKRWRSFSWTSKARGGNLAPGINIHCPSPFVGLSVRWKPLPLRLVGVALKRFCGASASLAWSRSGFRGLRPLVGVLFILLLWFYPWCVTGDVMSVTSGGAACWAASAGDARAALFDVGALLPILG